MSEAISSQEIYTGLLGLGLVIIGALGLASSIQFYNFGYQNLLGACAGMMGGGMMNTGYQGGFGFGYALAGLILNAVFAGLLVFGLFLIWKSTNLQTTRRVEASTS